MGGGCSCSAIVIAIAIAALLSVTTTGVTFETIHVAAVTSATALPLYTNGRWIVEEGGGSRNKRVKLACVNWVSHLDTAVTEGLNQQPVSVISKGIKSMRFNCVRLTWPLLLLTNDSLASLTVRDSLKNLGLLQSISGIHANNPSILDLPLIKAYQVLTTFTPNPTM